MTEQISKVQRWLDLVAYLVGRRVPVTVEELMESVPAYARKWEGGDDTDRATARRTFERDKDELRELELYIMVRADGRWYAVSRCRDVEGIRFFRADRVLEAELGDATFEVPDGFDVAEFLDEGHLYQPRDDVQVTVRYGSRVARWIRERGPVEERADGSVAVTHTVLDFDWIVRHVLRYGPEAEVVDPPAVRRRVAGAARRMAV